MSTSGLTPTGKLYHIIHYHVILYMYTVQGVLFYTVYTAECVILYVYSAGCIHANNKM